MNWRAQAYFLGHRLLGTDLTALHRKAQEFMTLRVDEMQSCADRRLSATLRKAVAVIPYYRERVSGSALAKFPVLTKDDIRNHFTDLMVPEVKEAYLSDPGARMTSWVEVRTGGSTGTPTQVIHGQSFREEGRVAKLLANGICGFPLGTPYAMLWGSMTDINSMKSDLGSRIQTYLFNASVLNAFRMTEAGMQSYAEYLRYSGVRHLMSYVDAAAEFARFILAAGGPEISLESVMLCAGTVTPDVRALVHDAFHATVHNKYGSRECGEMAVECAHQGFHIFAHRVHIEVVDERGNSLPPGMMGRILVTLLGNDEFPLIRYDIGDWGALRAGVCSCGMTLPMLDRIEGRTYEIIRDTRGGFVTPVFFRHLLGVVHARPYLRRFQIVQTGEREYDLSLEMREPISEDQIRRDYAPVVRDLAAVLGSDAVIRIVPVALIEETSSGKFLYSKNNYHPNPPA